jgi:hypothetical protein
MGGRIDVEADDVLLSFSTNRESRYGCPHSILA